jgi:hypothetical protein
LPFPYFNAFFLKTLQDIIEKKKSEKEKKKLKKKKVSGDYIKEKKVMGQSRKNYSRTKKTWGSAFHSKD